MMVHQGTGVASGWPNSRFTRLCRIASPSTQRRPPIVWATVRTPSWVSVVRSRVFGTSTGRVFPGLSTGAGAQASRWAASARRFGRW